MKIIYPGSFDPFTYGHYDVLMRAAKNFEEVRILVLNNMQKKYMFSITERLNIVEDYIKDAKEQKNITADTYEGLLIDYAKKYDYKASLRGLRAVDDFEMELQMANANRTLYKNFETFFLMTDPNFSFVSSTVVKQVMIHGGDVSLWVSDYVIEMFEKKLKESM
jgi:pantetheine-phosphate adenylyltransferase